jgi:hypothetical protein
MLNIKGEIEDYLVKTKEGVWEWKDNHKWNPMYLDYFKKREDDSLSQTDIILQGKGSS